MIEDAWLDRLQILHWNDRLAAHPRVHWLCSAAHVTELVARWMAIGSVGYRFASAVCAGEQGTMPQDTADLETTKAVEIPCEALIGELAVHRESLQRALSEQPECLSTILNALLTALDSAPARDEEVALQEEALAAM